MCVIANVQSLVQTEGDENLHVENTNKHGTEQPAKEDLNVDNTNEHGTEQPAKEDLNVDNTNEHGTEQPAKEDLNVNNGSVLPGSDADKGEYPPNEDCAGVPAKEDLDVDKSVLPQTSGDNGESSPNGDGTQSHVTEDLNVENNSVLPQVDIQLCDKGDSNPNGNDIQVPDKGDCNQNGHKADLSTQDISKEENVLKIRKKWNLPLMTVSLTDLDARIKTELAKKGMIIKPKPSVNPKKPDGTKKLIFAKLSQ